MSDMDGLVEFLRARLDEREATALAYLDTYDTDPRWHGWRVEADELVTSGGKVIVEAEAGLEPELLTLIAMNDPWTVLAEVEAKRRIVDLHYRAHHQCVAEDGPTQWHAADPCTTLRILTAPYADHPDYQPAWRP